MSKRHVCTMTVCFVACSFTRGTYSSARHSETSTTRPCKSRSGPKPKNVPRSAWSLERRWSNSKTLRTTSQEMLTSNIRNRTSKKTEEMNGSITTIGTCTMLGARAACRRISCTLQLSSLSNRIRVCSGKLLKYELTFIVHSPDLWCALRSCRWQWVERVRSIEFHEPPQVYPAFVMNPKTDTNNLHWSTQQRMSRPELRHCLP